MVLQIDNLKLPPDIGCTAELMNRDTQRQTVSGRLITKCDAVEKWKVTVNFKNITLRTDFQKAFYEKCMEMRNAAKTIRFVSPYTNEEVAITAKCIERSTPEALAISRRRPMLYGSIGAVFQQV